MKKAFKKILNIIKWLLIIIIIIDILFLIVRQVGRTINNRTPDGGINETLYVDVNGDKQWINIYGQDRDNPVLLYLHGGPGQATSDEDYVVLRKLSRDYTVVNWDQRACGKSWRPEHNNGTQVTVKQLLSDGEVMTDFLRDYMGKDKITVMGMSWGSMMGANLVLDHPEKYDAYIGLSFVVDDMEMLKAFKKQALEWTKDDAELHKIAENVKTEQSDWDAMTTDEMIEEANNYGKIYDKYTEPDSEFAGDVNVITAMIFNPYWSLKDYYNLFFHQLPRDLNDLDWFPYLEMITYGGRKDASVAGEYDYKVPFYLVNGDADYTIMFPMVKEYFGKVNAPDKAYYEVSGGHYMPMLHSERLAEIVHEIALKSGQ
ncbi:MAG: alpha/beta hydrolase [Ruminococcus sp.]|nr:alpha/beta hydrolase [Ruminococcus sp.]